MLSSPDRLPVAIETEVDETLSQELQIITDEAIYAELQSSDINSE